MSDQFVRPPSAPAGGASWLAWIGRSVLALLGWTTSGALPNTSKAVFIVAPHRSNWDWVIGVACFFAFRLKVRYLAKDSLFVAPLGWIMRATGGIAVNRSQPGDLAVELAKEFSAASHLWLAIAPEGTRGNVSRWKTGFLRIASEAEVPVYPVILNRQRREIEIGKAFALSGSIEQDLDMVQNFYRDRTLEETS
jgi:1-acyl-sn-glycerol-3-phosphate acyltransferase